MYTCVTVEVLLHFGPAAVSAAGEVAGVCGMPSACSCSSKAVAWSL